MRKLDFDKYEGTGNDFVVVEAEVESAVSEDEARALCDRRFGIGADGVLLVTPGAGDARARMVVLNADGSRPEMCGNGLRCVALHLARRDGASRVDLVIDTDAGPKHARVARSAAGDDAEVTVGMGRGQLLGERRFPVRGEEHAFTLVSMGNPHAIAFDLDIDTAEIDRIGPALSHATTGGTNVEAVTSRGGGRFDVLVWERGVGRTFACGTGAAAVAVAAAATGRAPLGERLEVRLPGGSLWITVARDTLDVTLTGPARRVFAGKVVS
ncbi:MAG TPA: diaminopimelate epimerase [Polyangiaceae bacterium]|nr:diaminopimelate epimerase [Polyangiaceae bacterium]